MGDLPEQASYVPSWAMAGLSLILRRPWRWGAAFALGALSSFAFAPYFYVPLMAVALAGFLLLIGLAQARAQAFSDGWWFGFGYFISGLYWIAESFANQPAVPDALGPPAVILLAAGLAFYPALVGLVTYGLARRGAPALFVFALTWGAGEWLRGYLFTGFPWNPVASVWAGSAVMLQPLSLVGSYGLGVLTVLIMASPALAFPHMGGKRGWLWPVAGILVLAIWAGFGMWRLSDNPTGWVKDATVRLVQPNIDQIRKWDRRLERQNFADYLSMSASLPAPDGRLVVIWPETAITDAAFDRTMGRRAIIARMLPENGFLITGAPRHFSTPDTGWAAANSLFIIDDDGHIAGLYDKHHLVPFGEYLPARGLLSLLGLQKLVGGTIDFSAGNGVTTLDLPGLPAISPLICYEAIFPGAVADSANRPGLLVNITNDAWFGTSIGPHQHFAQSRMRAVEEGLPLARSAGTGISAVIDPVGRVIARIPLATRGALDVTLPRALDGSSLYSKVGNQPFYLFLLFGFGAALWNRFTRYTRVE